MIPTNAVSLVTKWEGFHKKKSDGLAYPYICPAGYWTIGYGSTRNFDGSAITKDTPPISEPIARRLMEQELEKCVYFAIKFSPILVQHPDRLGAITSFIYNLGPGRYKISTLRTRINEQKWDLARTEILRWVYGSGRKLPGLVARRLDEASYL